MRVWRITPSSVHTVPRGDSHVPPFHPRAWTRLRPPTAPTEQCLDMRGTPAGVCSRVPEPAGSCGLETRRALSAAQVPKTGLSTRSEAAGPAGRESDEVRAAAAAPIQVPVVFLSGCCGQGAGPLHENQGAFLRGWGHRSSGWQGHPEGCQARGVFTSRENLPLGQKHHKLCVCVFRINLMYSK